MGLRGVVIGVVPRRVQDAICLARVAGNEAVQVDLGQCTDLLALHAKVLAPVGLPVNVCTQVGRPIPILIHTRSMAGRPVNVAANHLADIAVEDLAQHDCRSP